MGGIRGAPRSGSWPSPTRSITSLSIFPVGLLRAARLGGAGAVARRSEIWLPRADYPRPRGGGHLPRRVRDRQLAARPSFAPPPV